MGFYAGAWLHEAPDSQYRTGGRRAVVRHLCFGPLEVRTWYRQKDGQYCREIHFLEGPQEGERYTDFIGRAEMLEVLGAEIALCEQYQERALSVLFQAERDLASLPEGE